MERISTEPGGLGNIASTPSAHGTAQNPGTFVPPSDADDYLVSAEEGAMGSQAANAEPSGGGGADGPTPGSNVPANAGPPTLSPLEPWEGGITPGPHGL